MTSRRSTVLAASLFLGVAGVAFPAAAAPPTIEREDFEDSFPDEFLSEQCGVEVVTSLVGRRTTRTWDRQGSSPQEITTINVSFTATAGDNSYRFRDVGSDSVRRAPDGTLLVSIRGQVPFEFKGVLKLSVDGNVETVLHQPRRTVDTARACAALTR
jgi:hypothetical protein